MAAALAVCVLAAGCGTAHMAAHARGTSTLTKTHSRTVTAAGNRAAARAEAAKLLALARLPHGAVRLARPPRSLSHAAIGAPAAKSLVDLTAVWRVALPFATAHAWLSAHPPAGLSAGGEASSGNTITGRTYTEGSSYEGPSSPAWQTAELNISIAPYGPHATAIRADGVVVWLDPRPVRSSPGAHPLRVTLAGGCPASDRGVTGVTNGGPGLTAGLLPRGEPTAGLRCRYEGMNGHPFRLIAATRLTRAEARRAAKTIAATPLSHPDGEVVNCPLNDGSAQVLVLAYPGRADIDLWITPTGCGGISNGHIIAGGI